MDRYSDYRPHEQVYTGEPLEPEIEVYANGDNSPRLQEGTEYTVDYSDNVQCGAGFAYATGAGEVSDQLTVYDTFAIIPTKASIESVTAGPRSLIVNVKDQSESGITGYQVQYRIEGTEEWQTKQFDVSSTELMLTDLEVGEKYEVQVAAYVDIPEEDRGWSLNESYTGEPSDVKTSDAISPQSVEGATVEVADQTYTGDPLTPEVTVVLDGVTLSPETDHTVEYKDNVEVGAATVTVTGIGNYTGSVEGTFVIAPVVYAVIVEQTEGGVVAVDKESAAAGAEVTITVTPEEGWELDAISVTTADGEAVEVEDGTFTMPASDVTVEATFKKKDSSSPDSDTDNTTDNTTTDSNTNGATQNSVPSTTTTTTGTTTTGTTTTTSINHTK